MTRPSGSLVENELTQLAGSDGHVWLVHVDERNIVSAAQPARGAERYECILLSSLAAAGAFPQVVSPDARPVPKQHGTVIDPDRIVRFPDGDANLSASWHSPI